MRLRPGPCVDSDALGEARRRELDIDRATATELGLSAVQAATDGWYSLADGTRVDWRQAVERTIAAKMSIPPELPQRLAEGKGRFAETAVSVVNETTLAAALRLIGQGARPLALNMANGVSPGGGFLNGARAQEESICRSSALYATLVNDPMYSYHQQRGDHESSDWMILSADVPVFRSDSGVALATPWLCSFLTCAAPYQPRVGSARSAALLTTRIARLLTVAAANSYDTLVLGAWGCGAFHNDPVKTAADFRAALEGPFSGCFREVVFAVTDWSADRRFLGPFREQFAAP